MQLTDLKAIYQLSQWYKILYTSRSPDLHKEFSSQYFYQSRSVYHNSEPQTPSPHEDFQELIL